MAKNRDNPKSNLTELHSTSAELFTRYQTGNDEVADEIFHRYLERLTRLARSRLSPRLASRTDPEDIVLSAWRSFFLGARAGKYALHRSGDLWRLLATITMHKVYRQARHHNAELRSVKREQSLDQMQDEFQPVADRMPSPEEALVLADELESIMSGLDVFERRVLELRLQGETLAAIATDTARSERTVRRVLAQLRERLVLRWETERDG
ncbi:MAG: sigma-70 family RNA polymerase sigma factor [Planctomycetaceae bacterium]|nr:sigma-70 family RNA polymerase sigma factor [Planctomycetaceae bacterium]